MDDIDNPQAGADDPTNATGNDNNNTTNNNTDEPPGNTQDAPDAPTLNTNTTNPTGADELLNRIEQARTTNNITAIVQAINRVDISTLPLRPSPYLSPPFPTTLEPNTRLLSNTRPPLLPPP